MKVIIDENIPRWQVFEQFGQVRRMPGREIARTDLLDADVLIVRSVTRVDAALLDGTAVRFVGSASAGTDHVALDSLIAAGIHFVNAPGSNADSVGDYVLAAIATLLPSNDLLAGRSVGIIGCGHVGSRLLQRLPSLVDDIRVCDPFLAPHSVPGLGSLEEALDCDIVTLHTPLTRVGQYPTHHLLGAEQLARLRPGALLINSARGEVVDLVALHDVFARRADLRVVLDVFEGEPLVSDEVLKHADLLTPHIAGYAWDGKLRGTEMIYSALCNFMQRPALWVDGNPPVNVHLGALEVVEPPDLPLALLRYCYDLRAESDSYRRSAGKTRSDRSQVFDKIRRDYPRRREFAASQVVLPAGYDVATVRRIRQLGFNVIGPPH